MSNINELHIIRNGLSKGKYNESTEEQILLLKERLSKKQKSRYMFMLKIIELAEQEITNGHYFNAAIDFNLIHNFPEDEEKVIDDDYFYQVEFVNYYDKLIKQKKYSKIKYVMGLLSAYLIDI